MISIFFFCKITIYNYFSGFKVSEKIIFGIQSAQQYEKQIVKNLTTMEIVYFKTIQLLYIYILNF